MPAHSEPTSESTTTSLSAVADGIAKSARKPSTKPVVTASLDTAESQVQRPAAAVLTGDTRDPHVIQKLGAAFERYISLEDMDCGTQGPSKRLWWENVNERGLQKLAAGKSDILVRMRRCFRTEISCV